MTVLPDLQSAEWRHGQRPSTGLCCWESVACVQLRWRTCSVFQVMSCCNWQPRALCSIMCSIKCTYAAPTALHRLQSEGHWLNKHGRMRQQSTFGIPWAEEGGKLKFSFFFKKTKKSLLACRLNDYLSKHEQFHCCCAATAERDAYNNLFHLFFQWY